MIGSLFKPKWQHRNPDVRKKALAQLAEKLAQRLADNPAENAERAGILEQVARHDAEPELRLFALRRVDSLHVLLAAAQGDSDATVAREALNRAAILLTGRDKHSPDFATRLRLVKATDEQFILEQVALKGQESELRATAQTLVQRSSVLVQVVLKEPQLDLRLAALERIADQTTLERIQKAARKKDKRVFRRTTERLQDMLIAAGDGQARRDRQDELVKHLEALAFRDNKRGESVLGDWEQRWQNVATEAPVGLLKRVEKARATVLGTSVGEVTDATLNTASNLLEGKARRQLRLDREAVCQQLDTLLERLNQDDALAEFDPASSRAELDAIHQRWSELEAQASVPLNVAQRYRLSRESTEAAHGRLSAALAQRGQAQTILRQMQQALEHKRLPAQADIEQWQKQWQQKAAKAPTELHQRYERNRNRLLQRLEQHKQRALDAETSASTQLAQLKQQLEAGQVKAAHGLLASFEKHYKRLDEAHKASLRDDYLDIRSQLRGLAGWQSWGADQAKVELCLSAENLPNQNLEPLELAKQIKALQQRWRQLDQQQRAAGDARRDEDIWQRFNGACQVAYEPCKAFYEEQSQQRQGKQTALEAQIAELQALAEPSNRDGWKALDKTLRQARTALRTVNEIDRKERNKVAQGLKQAMQAPHEWLHDYQQRSLRLKQGLLEEAQTTVAKAADSAEAAEGLKAIQQRWKQAGFGPRKQEQALWEQLREVCDPVFGAREQAHQANQQASQQRRQQLQSWVEQLESWGAETIELEGVQSRINQFNEQWQTAVTKADSALQGRYDKAMKQLRLAIKAARSDAERAKLQALLERATALADVYYHPDAEQALASWQGLPVLADEQWQQRLQALVEQRLDEQQLQANTEQAEDWLLQLECELGVDSPAQFQQARMDRQVERLSASFGSQDSAQEPEKLLVALCLLGPVQAEANTLVQQRIQALVKAL